MMNVEDASERFREVISIFDDAIYSIRDSDVPQVAHVARRTVMKYAGDRY